MSAPKICMLKNMHVKVDLRALPHVPASLLRCKAPKLMNGRRVELAPSAEQVYYSIRRTASFKWPINDLQYNKSYEDK